MVVPPVELFRRAVKLYETLLLVVRAMPGLIRVVALHVLDDLQRVRSQVLLVHDSVVADHECLHARDTIFRRHGNQRKPADHRALDHVVELAERRSRTLPFQNFEVVAVEGLPLVPVAFLNGLRDRLADGTSPTAVRILPGQPILFSRCADDSLRVLIHSGVVVDLLGVFLLGLDKAAADGDGIQFVGPDAPVKNLIPAGLRIEMPLSALLDDRNRKGQSSLPTERIARFGL